MTAQEARERVSRGAALLDEKRPGWADEINLKDFDISTCTECALGQLYGGFGEGAAVLFNHRYSEAVRHGFAIQSGDGVESKDTQPLWIEAIAERVSAAPVVTWTHRELVQS